MYSRGYRWSLNEESAALLWHLVPSCKTRVPRAPTARLYLTLVCTHWLRPCWGGVHQQKWLVCLNVVGSSEVAKWSRKQWRMFFSGSPSDTLTRVIYALKIVQIEAKCARIQSRLCFLLNISKPEKFTIKSSWFFLEKCSILKVQVAWNIIPWICSCDRNHTRVWILSICSFSLAKQVSL